MGGRREASRSDSTIPKRLAIVLHVEVSAGVGISGSLSGRLGGGWPERASKLIRLALASICFDLVILRLGRGGVVSGFSSFFSNTDVESVDYLFTFRGSSFGFREDSFTFNS